MKKISHKNCCGLIATNDLQLKYFCLEFHKGEKFGVIFHQYKSPEIYKILSYNKTTKIYIVEINGKIQHIYNIDVRSIPVKSEIEVYKYLQNFKNALDKRMVKKYDC